MSDWRLNQFLVLAAWIGGLFGTLFQSDGSTATGWTTFVLIVAAALLGLELFDNRSSKFAASEAL